MKRREKMAMDWNGPLWLLGKRGKTGAIRPEVGRYGQRRKVFSTRAREDGAGTERSVMMRVFTDSSHHLINLFLPTDPPGSPVVRIVSHPDANRSRRGALSCATGFGNQPLHHLCSTNET